MPAGLTPKIITGLPQGVKGRPRADFIPEEFDILVHTKGYRLWWSRAGICPCTNNDQTEQPDVNCSLCRGKAYYYFLPDPAVEAGAIEDAEGNPVEVNDARDAVLIQGIMTSLTKDPQVFEKFGEWIFGTSQVSVQHQNKLGYRDRLVAVDSVLAWAQVIEFDGSSEITVSGGYSKAGLRYPVVQVNQFRSVNSAFREGEDFEITPTGTLRWLTSPPTTGTRLSLHCWVRPVWIVLDHMHTYRDTLVEKDAPGPAIADQFRRMPIQVAVKLDYLVNP